MNYKKALENLGLIENEDFTLTVESFEMLPKTKQVEQVIQHPEVAEVVGQEAHGIIPATFDANGNQLTPMIPAQEAIEAVSFQAAWEEVVTTEEVYYMPTPSIEDLKLALIEDVALAVSEYLADKDHLRDSENDSINIVDNRIHSWNFSNIAQPSVAELYEAHILAEAKNNQEEINRVALKYLADTDYKVLRHLRQKALAIPTSLSEEEYLQLETLRHAAAQRIS